MALSNNRICGASIRMKKSNDRVPAGNRRPRAAWVTPPPREAMARRNHCFLERSVTFKLSQLSLACPVKRAHPPWTVDDKALIP